jgi:hypothetical protein
MGGSRLLRRNAPKRGISSPIELCGPDLPRPTNSARGAGKETNHVAQDGVAHRDPDPQHLSRAGRRQRGLGAGPWKAISSGLGACSPAQSSPA